MPAAQTITQVLQASAKTRRKRDVLGASVAAFVEMDARDAFEDDARGTVEHFGLVGHCVPVLARMPVAYDGTGAVV